MNTYTVILEEIEMEPSETARRLEAAAKLHERIAAALSAAHEGKCAEVSARHLDAAAELRKAISKPEDV